MERKSHCKNLPKISPSLSLKQILKIIMSKSISILEPEIKELNQKTQSLSKIFDIIRIYSSKMRNHFEIFAHLINDLVENDEKI